MGTLYIDARGDVVVPIDADSCTVFGDGLGGVYRGTKLEIVNENGSVLGSCRGVYADGPFSEGRMDAIPSFVDIGNFVGGLAPAQINESGVYKWGYIDRNGSWKIKPKFEEAYDFIEGIAEVIPLGLDPDDIEQMGYIKPNGEYIWEPSTI